MKITAKTFAYNAQPIHSNLTKSYSIVHNEPGWAQTHLGFRRGGTMNNKKLAAFAAAGLGSIMLIGSTGIANAADVTPTPSASATASASTKGDPAKQALREANATARKAIHETFKAAVEKARADFRAVLATNPTDTAKAAAVQARKAAVDAAKSAQLTSMLAINPNWTPHAKGDHPAKADKPAS